MYGKSVARACLDLVVMLQCTKGAFEFTPGLIKSFPHWEFTCLNFLLVQISTSNRTKRFWLFSDEELVPEEDFNTELPLQAPQILKALDKYSLSLF